MQTLPYKLLEETIGIPTEIKSNEFNEIHTNTHHKIVFQIKEEEPDLWAFGVLFTLSLMSFTFAAPRGISENYFIPFKVVSLFRFLFDDNLNPLCIQIISHTFLQ